MIKHTAGDVEVNGQSLLLGLDTVNAVGVVQGRAIGSQQHQLAFAGMKGDGCGTAVALWGGLEETVGLVADGILTQELLLQVGMGLEDVQGKPVEQVVMARTGTTPHKRFCDTTEIPGYARHCFLVEGMPFSSFPG